MRPRTEPLFGLIEFDLWHGMHLLCQRNTIPQWFGKIQRESESFLGKWWEFFGVLFGMRLSTSEAVRGIAVHLLPHSEMVFTGQRELNLQIIVINIC